MARPCCQAGVRALGLEVQPGVALVTLGAVLFTCDESCRHSTQPIAGAAAAPVVAVAVGRNVAWSSKFQTYYNSLIKLCVFVVNNMLQLALRSAVQPVHLI
jgi:hypothetical protein